MLDPWPQIQERRPGILPGTSDEAKALDDALSTAATTSEEDIEGLEPDRLSYRKFPCAALMASRVPRPPPLECARPSTAIDSSTPSGIATYREPRSQPLPSDIPSLPSAVLLLDDGNHANATGRNSPGGGAGTCGSGGGLRINVNNDLVSGNSNINESNNPNNSLSSSSSNYNNSASNKNSTNNSTNSSTNNSNNNSNNNNNNTSCSGGGNGLVGMPLPPPLRFRQRTVSAPQPEDSTSPGRLCPPVQVTRAASISMSSVVSCSSPLGSPGRPMQKQTSGLQGRLSARLNINIDVVSRDTGSKNNCLDHSPADIAKRQGYHLLESLGQGSTGVVYAARRSDGKRVACKVMRMQDEELLMSARNEHELQSSLHHAHIVQALDFLTGPQGAVLVLECFPGKTLSQVVSEAPLGRLHVVDCSRLAAGALSAVGYMHKKSILHRDVKADNIMVTPDLKDMVLIDFNTAELAFEGGTLTMAGTADYMSPEVLCGKEQTPAADIWALGLCLHLMLSGKLPLERNMFRSHEEFGQQLAKLFRQEAPLSRPEWATLRLPEPCLAVLGACLQVDHRSRPTAAEISAMPWMLLAPSLEISSRRHFSQLADPVEGGGAYPSSQTSTKKSVPSEEMMRRRLRKDKFSSDPIKGLSPGGRLARLAAKAPALYRPGHAPTLAQAITEPALRLADLAPATASSSSTASPVVSPLYVRSHPVSVAAFSKPKAALNGTDQQQQQQHDQQQPPSLHHPHLQSQLSHQQHQQHQQQQLQLQQLASKCEEPRPQGSTAYPHGRRSVRRASAPSVVPGEHPTDPSELPFADAELVIAASARPLLPLDHHDEAKKVSKLEQSRCLGGL